MAWKLKTQLYLTRKSAGKQLATQELEQKQVEAIVEKIPEGLQKGALAELRRKFRKPRKYKRYPFEGQGKGKELSEAMQNFVEWNKNQFYLVSCHDMKCMEPFHSMEHACYYKRGPRKGKRRRSTGDARQDVMEVEKELGSVVDKLIVKDQVRRLHEDPQMQKLMEESAGVTKRKTKVAEKGTKTRSAMQPRAPTSGSKYVSLADSIQALSKMGRPQIQRQVEKLQRFQ